MFEPGQKVICVDNTPRDGRPESIKALSKIKVGETYTVREIFESNNPSQYSITLDEVETMYSKKLGREMGYKADRFRPYDTYSWVEETLNRLVEEAEEEFTVRVPKKF
jgi:hypothetical protein